MGYLIGAGLAIAVGLFAGVAGFDRDRSFYPVVLTIIAVLYILFAAIAESRSAMFMELFPAIVFIAAAVFGFKKSLWLVVGGLAMHGVFDFFHQGIINNPGVPAWWPAFCLAYDITAAAYLGVLIRFREGTHAAARA